MICQNIGFVGQNPQVFGDLFEQFLVLVDQLLLFEIDQLAERHAQDRIGLHGGQRVSVGLAPFLLEQCESRRRPVLAASSRRAFDSHQTDFGLRLSSRGTNDANDLVDIGQGQQQAFDRVLSLATAGEQEFRPTANDDERGAAGTPPAAP